MTLRMKNLYVYYLTSTYIPSLLLVLISYLTFLFELEDFSNRIMVSLTSLLVLAALFSQISSTLPHTSYLKLIDIWFLICIIIDFTMIVCLVIINKRIRKLSAYKLTFRHFFNSLTSKMLNKFTQIVMFFVITFFVIIYCTIVISL